MGGTAVGSSTPPLQAPVDPRAQLFDDLRAAQQLFWRGQYLEAWISIASAIVRMLAAHRAFVSPETAAQLTEMSLPPLLLADALEALPPTLALRLERPVIRRYQRALVAGCVEALIRRNWNREEAGEFVGRIVGMRAGTAVNLRNTLARQQRRLQLPATFANMQAHVAAAIEGVPAPKTEAGAEADARRVASVLRKQRKDLALYQECLDMLAGHAIEVLPVRITEILQAIAPVSVCRRN